LLLRATVGLTLATQAWLAAASSSLHALFIVGVVILCGVALAVGICTRLAGTLAVVTYAAALFGPQSGSLLPGADSAAAIIGMAAAIAIAVLGPGALSIDARLFGRREIFIPGNSDPR
jgi:uncharacterized membrane protein YphA (DoxX/SURF4 family)